MRPTRGVKRKASRISYSSIFGMVGAGTGVMPSKRILVVDDDPSIRRLVTTVLEREHYEVDTAEGGKDAISQIELTRYDVIMLDLMMPGVSGLDVLKWLAVRNPESKCVVVMSAGSRFEVARSITPNVFATLSKPFDVEALITAAAGCIEAACDPVTPPNHLRPVPKAA
jgi:DNA-binding NtrC family response regulator